MKRDIYYTRGVVGYQVGNPPPNDPPLPAPPADDDAAQLRFAADAARAEAARIKRELDEARRQLPTDEQRARWQELEVQAQAAEEERMRRAGEFDGWRNQIQATHERELTVERQRWQNEEAARKQAEKELEDTLIGREFADALDLFGPDGKTVLLPQVAQSYFGRHVVVETANGPDGKPHRRVVVKDSSGTTIVDPRTGQPQPFSKAMAEVIDAHPQRAHLLRGSGKVGAGSSGGGVGGSEIDLGRLRPNDFQDPRVRDKVREQSSKAGGLQIGPAFDRMKRTR